MQKNSKGEKMEHEEKILIVQDDKMIRDSLFCLFEREGFFVNAAESNEEALKKFREDKFDLLLVDLEMMGISGLEQLVKELKNDNDTIIILITEFGSIPTAILALKNGVYDYITKPISPNELSHRVKNAFEQRALNIENKQLRDKLEEIISESQHIKSIFNEDDGDNKSLSAFEKKYILKILNENNWNISRSAHILEIDRVTLYNKINKYGLKKETLNEQ
ncbi:MAG: hypothetical protein A2V93_00620 [Ignavibacteria bacterium RBG_16_34_14]|nr:MAG: hypothetical protein A2V93_00620 [Ignavibacteria bacterium RBG_16_34_14]